MFGRSPYLDHLPVLSLEPGRTSQYKLRRSRCGDHFCTSEVAALCLNLAGDQVAGQTLEAYPLHLAAIWLATAAAAG